MGSSRTAALNGGLHGTRTQKTIGTLAFEIINDGHWPFNSVIGWDAIIPCFFCSIDASLPWLEPKVLFCSTFHFVDIPFCWKDSCSIFLELCCAPNHGVIKIIDTFWWVICCELRSPSWKTCHLTWIEGNTIVNKYTELGLVCIKRSTRRLFHRFFSRWLLWPIPLFLTWPRSSDLSFVPSLFKSFHRHNSTVSVLAIQWRWYQQRWITSTFRITTYLILLMAIFNQFSINMPNGMAKRRQVIKLHFTRNHNRLQWAQMLTHKLAEHFSFRRRPR